MESDAPIRAFYETHNEDARLLSRCGRVEFLTTMRFIEPYLRPGLRVLEIGAGSGRYSHALARQGCHVDAVELTDVNIAAFMAHTEPGEDISIVKGSAVDLSAFESDAYDLTLLLGPMYHLFTPEEEAQALREAVRVTKKGGVLMTAYCLADAAIMQHGFMKGNAARLVQAGLLDPVSFRASSRPEDVFVLHLLSDIDAFDSALPVTRLRLVGTDMFSHYVRPALDAMDEDAFRLYLDYHFSICQRSDLVGISNHVLDILRKE